MSGSTIDSKITVGVTLGMGGYSSPLTITAIGEIKPDTTNTTALKVSTSNGYVLNHGKLIGGVSTQFYGGDGLNLTAGTVVNTGLISGGDGKGGYGAILSGGTLINNMGGTIAGGSSLPTHRTNVDAGGVDLHSGLLINLGLIKGGGDEADGKRGGRGVIVSPGSTLINHGTIIGGYGAEGVRSYINGEASALTNTGLVIGGSGDFGGHAGLLLYANDQALFQFTNTGTLEGGVGLTSSIATAGGSGFGDFASGLSINNSGLILGGAASDANSQSTGGEPGGDGLVLGYGTLKNTGTIIGGDGNNGQTQGQSGAGVYIGGGTFINAGVVSGGSGSVMGDAVMFNPREAGTLIADPDAVFNGLVVTNTASAAADVLLFGGEGGGVVTGIGTEFQDFEQIGFTAGAERTIEGGTAGFHNAVTISGFDTGDKIIIDGFSEKGASVSATGIVLSSAGTAIKLGFDEQGYGGLQLIVTGSATATTISHLNNLPGAGITLSGHQTGLVAAGGTATMTYVKAGATLEVGAGGYGIDPMIAKGGIAQIYSGATVDAAIINGGRLDLFTGGSAQQSVNFTGTGGVFDIHGTVMPSVVISGFVQGDTIELANVTYQAGATAMVTSPGTVTITDGGTNYTLNIAGTTLGESLLFGSGSELTVGTAQMDFIRSNRAEMETPAMVHCGRFGYIREGATQTVSLPMGLSAGSAHSGLLELVETVHKGGTQSFIVHTL